MKRSSLVVLALLFAATFNSFAQSAEKEKNEYKDTAYKSIDWNDSPQTAIKKIGKGRVWAAGKYGYYRLDELIDQATKEEDIRTVLKKYFIAREVRLNVAKTVVHIYWFELNDKNRPSKLIDKIIKSKLVIVRVEFSSEYRLKRLMSGLEDRYGHYKITELEDTPYWKGYKKAEVYKQFSDFPKREYKWEKGNVCLKLYDWSGDDDDDVEICELVKENKEAIEDIKKDINKEVAAMEKLKKDQKKIDFDKATNF
jgi:hypothetical protein